MHLSLLSIYNLVYQVRILVNVCQDPEAIMFLVRVDIHAGFGLRGSGTLR